MFNVLFYLHSTNTNLKEVTSFIFCGLNALWDRIQSKMMKIDITSDDKLLSIDTGVSLGALQQGDPMMHLLRSVSVAVQHTIRRDNDKGVRPETV